MSNIKSQVVGEKLRCRREIFKLDRSELAAMIDVLPQFVANWERGQCLPPRKVIPKLMKVLEMDKSYIICVYKVAAERYVEDYFDKILND